MTTIIKILDILWVSIGLLGIFYLLIRDIPEKTQEKAIQENRILFLLGLSFLLFMISIAVRNTEPITIEWIAAGLYAIFVFFLSDFKRIPWIRICILIMAYVLAVVSLLIRLWPTIMEARPVMVIFSIVDFLWFFSSIVFALLLIFESKLGVKPWTLLISVVGGIVAYILTFILICLHFPKENVFAFIMWFVTLVLVFVLCAWGLNLPDKNKKGKSIGWITYVSFVLPFAAFLSQILERWFFRF